MKTKSIPNRILLYTLILAIGIAFIVSGISVAVKSSASKKRTQKVGEAVLTIGDLTIPRDEFIFNCVLTIESELSDIARNGIVESELNELIKEKTVQNLEEYAAMLFAAKTAGIALTEAEKVVIENDAETKGDETFFRENYNISREKYIEIKENWKICEKYLENIKKAENISQTEMEEICKNHYTELFSAKVNAIFFDTSTLDDGASGLNKIEADNTYERLLTDEGLFETLYQEYDDHAFPGDTPLTLIDYTTYRNFPEVFEAVYEGNEGDLFKLETKSGIFIIQIIEKGDMKESAKLSEIYAGHIIDKIKENAEAAEKTDAYNSIDVTKYIDERSKLN